MAASKKRRRADLFEHLLHFLQQRISPGQHLLLGLSGGLDSCVLLDLLVQAREHLDFHLSAIHVHHGISPNANKWAEFCLSLCAKFDVDFQLIEIEVDRHSGLGLEAAARQARYQALASVCHSGDIVLAHHRDDQAETVLLQLLRGAGVHGLASMPAVITGESAMANRRLLRPLLDFSRVELTKYAQERQLAWMDDESNFDESYDRNFLRLDVFPRLGERFPAFSTNLARSAKHLGEAAELLDEVAAQDAVQAIDENRLDLQALSVLTSSRAKNLLRWWIKQQTSSAPSSAKLEEVLKQLQARPDAQMCVVMGEWELRRYRQAIYLERRIVPVSYFLEWTGESEVILPGAGRLVFRESRGTGVAMHFLQESKVTIRSRSGGESFRLDHKRPRRSLKNLFQEAGVPAWQRVIVPLVYIDQHLAFVPGLGIKYDYLANKDELSVTIEWHH